jgi:hypothetical protein
MAAIEIKRFDAPDETRPFQAHGHLELVNVGGREIGRAVFEPGWRWSNDVKPIAQTDSCEFAHLGYIVSGRMRVTMDDGTEGELTPGCAFAIPPGHDAEVIGDEPCVMIDVGEEDTDYAKSPGA